MQYSRLYSFKSDLQLEVDCCERDAFIVWILLVVGINFYKLDVDACIMPIYVVISQDSEQRESPAMVILWNTIAVCWSVCGWESGAKSGNRRKLKRINEHDAKLRSHCERRYRRIQYEVEELLRGWKTAQTNPIYSWVAVRSLGKMQAEPFPKSGTCGMRTNLMQN